MSTTDRLRSHFEEQSDALSLVGKGPEAAQATGTRYRRRRHVSTAAMSLASIALVGFVTLNLGNAPANTDGEIAAAQPSSSLAPTLAGGGGLTDSELNWEVVNLESGGLGDLYAWEGTYYALSTVPGTRVPGQPVAQAIYSSTDAINWSMDVLADDLWVSDLDHYQGRLYTVGTAPAVAPTRGSPLEIRAQAAVSADGGDSWNMTDLPVSAMADFGERSVRSTQATAQIAAGAKGVVAVIDTRFEVDYSEYVPSEAMTEFVSVRRTATGIEALDYEPVMQAEMDCADAWELLHPDGGGVATTTIVLPSELVPDETPAECQGIEDGSIQNRVVFSATWPELGVADPPANTFSEIFVSGEGSDWEPVTSPFEGGSITQLTATDDGFLAVEMADTDPIYYAANSPIWRLWSSPDGRVWEELDGDFDFSWIRSIGAVGNSIVIVGQMGATGPSSPAVLVSADGGSTWSNVDLSFLSGFEDSGMEWLMTRSDVGAHGLVLALRAAARFENQDEPERIGSVIFTEDFVSWTELPYKQLGLDAGDLVVGGIVNEGDKVVVLARLFGSGPDWQHLALIGTKP